MPKESSPAFARGIIAHHLSMPAAAATVSTDFDANTLATIFGGAAGFVPGFRCIPEKLQFIVGGADFAGAGGTLEFVLRRDTATGLALATLTITLAAALRGVVLSAAVTASDAAAYINDTDKLFITRTATGTVFTTGYGIFQVIGRQRLQARV